ncbi:MAG: patatin-like phospholipase family protein [Oleiphilaceae bacterium]|nr:patatin-like phospholipase family protein [Oleiphilaceae bacterium]
MKRFLLSFLALCFTTHTAAQEAPNETSCPKDLQRPCIGLVLGGGGAKGAAHVGVLKAIEEAKIPVDVIAGTSVGSFVAGLYATGQSAKDIESKFLSADWNRGYQDSLPRSRIPNRRKRHNDLFPIQLDIGLDSSGIKLPKGIIQGQGMRSLVHEMLGSYSKFDSFDSLAIPYRAVAADLETGEQVILSRGDLAQAMQASMSIPGVLRPTEIDGRILVDGGIANNLPVSVARQMGADIVIAVDIGAPILKREEIDSSVAVLGQMSNFLMMSNQAEARSTLTERDILIRPDLGNMGVLDFDAMSDALEEGYQLATEVFSKRSDIQLLRDSIARKTQEEKDQIHQIRLINNTRLANKYLLERMQLDGPPPFTREQINKGIERLLGQGTIALITSSIEIVNDEEQLILTVNEKEWGPGYLDFQFNFEDNFRSFSLFEIGTAWRYTNLNPYGAEWTNAVEFGTEKRLTSDIYWPLNTSGYFIQARTEIAREISTYSDNNQNLGELTRSYQNTKAGIGYEFSDNFDLLLGLEFENGRVKVPDPLQQIIGASSVRYDSGAAFIKTEYDNQNNPNFTRNGWKVSATGKRSESNALGFKEYVDQVEIQIQTAFSFGYHSIKPTIKAGSTYVNQGNLQFSGFELGGFLNLSGNDRDFIAGPHMRFARLVYSYELAANSVGGTKLPLYLGASYEAGNVWDNQSDISTKDLISSGAVFLGWDSPIGPAFLGYGISENSQESLYVSLGKGL